MGSVARDGPLDPDESGLPARFMSGSIWPHHHNARTRSAHLPGPLGRSRGLNVGSIANVGTIAPERSQDSFTLSSFGVYSSFISGNTTKTGLQAGRGNFAEAGTTCSLFRYLSWGSLSERFLRTEPPAMNFGANCGSSQACWPPASSWCTSRRLRGCASRSSV